MKWLLAAATEHEIAPFLAAGLPVDSVITGVGVPSSLFHITSAISRNRYDLVIQAGLAGSFHEGFRPGEIAAVISDVFAEEGILEKGLFTPLQDSHLAEGGSFPFQDGLLVNPELPGWLGDVKKAKAVTVGIITDDPVRIGQVRQAFSPDIETMEGASLHYVALQHGIPFLQLRAVSNFVGERNKANWKLEESIAGLNEFLLDMARMIMAGDKNK